MAIPPSSITCDYLIIGAGLSGLAFADAFLARAKIEGKSYRLVIVDERDQPGGHWNDAYKFARLHYPSAHYGVSSLTLEKPVPLGHEPHRATPNELLTYFQDFVEKIVREQDVVYFPMSTVRDGDKVVSLLNPKQEVHVQVNCKIVETTHLRVQPPVARAPPFEVAMGAVVVPPNHLSSISVASRASKFVIIGAGRTSIDVVLWLHSRHVPAEQLHWVVPRDHWLMCREAIVGEAWEKTHDDHTRAAMIATSLEHMGELCDARGPFCRVDPRQEAQAMHGACVSQAELAILRRVTNIVRLGRVRVVTASQLILEHGVYNVGEGALYVDCTGNWIQQAPEPVPIFSPGRIVVQPVGEVLTGPGIFNMAFCAALIGFVEVLHQSKDHTRKNALVTPVRWPDTIRDWIRCHVLAAQNLQLWSDRRVSSFLCGDRLSFWSGASEHAIRNLLSKYAEHRQKMCLCLQKLLSADKVQRVRGDETKVVAKDKAESATEADTKSSGTPPTPNQLPG